MEKSLAIQALRTNANYTQGWALENYVARVVNGEDPIKVLQDQREEEDKHDLMTQSLVGIPQPEPDFFKGDPFYPRSRRRPQFAE